MSWTSADIPDLTGRRAVVTGATGGLGFHTALELARHGAEVAITARSEAKASDTVERLQRELPGRTFDVVALDLADLSSVRRAATETASRYERIDLLVNNAGIMVPPRSTTVDGFELQMGTNHLGHFAWTALLWDALAPDARVVVVSSLAHTQAHGIDLLALTPQGSPRRYRRWQTYAESKLANLVFAQELHRRLEAAGSGISALAAHPGLASTNLQKTGVAMGNPLLGSAFAQVSKPFSQSAAAGALPSLRAATDPSARSGEYYGPSGLGGTRGKPVTVGMTRWARDPELAAALWTASEHATGTTFGV